MLCFAVRSSFPLLGSNHAPHAFYFGLPRVSFGQDPSLDLSRIESVGLKKVPRQPTFVEKNE